MRQERRHAPRLRVILKTRWAIDSYWHTDIIPNISGGGCFIITAAKVPVGTSVRVQVGLSKALSMMVEGTVVRRQRGRGLGVSFGAASVVKRGLLEKLIQRIQNGHP